MVQFVYNLPKKKKFNIYYILAFNSVYSYTI